MIFSTQKVAKVCVFSAMVFGSSNSEEDFHVRHEKKKKTAIFSTLLVFVNDGILILAYYNPYM